MVVLHKLLKERCFIKFNSTVFIMPAEMIAPVKIVHNKASLTRTLFLEIYFVVKF